jgi:hypothetical protein
MSKLVVALMFCILVPVFPSYAQSLYLTSAPVSPQTYTDFVRDVTPEYKIKNKVPLTKVSTTRRKDAFTFVFVMNKREKVEKSPSQMHVVWTGSKKIVSDQKVIEDKYPLDVSIDNYDDGFASGEPNMVLPSRRPKGIGVAFVWAF